ncbi:hypothetical protein [Cohnella cholangitidis]|uniref:Lipoprotein n=1 Tax=Cohnella cholangitidis TaxID=2598458 RepID=A0A7G5BTQ7_9BACL|nr:hypothetical protein [Cohnella cholangitidis]QMV40341.1 hypothetical protein FPL14_03330 [Cohnella cholangitidis]
MKGMAWLAAALLIMAGCSGRASEFKADTFSKDDLCIVESGGSRAKICYGDSRSEVEKALGQGKDTGALGYVYDNGVTVMYRDDAAAGILLKEESAGKFKTVRGASISDSKSSIKRLYGEKVALDATEHNLDYIYDSRADRFFDGGPNDPRQTMEDSVDTYILSALFNEDGYATLLMVIDRRMAVYFK